MHLKTWLSYGEINFILYFNTAHIGRVNLNFERFFQKKQRKILILKALRSNGKQVLQTNCFSNNQNTPSTEPINFDQSGTILGGGCRYNFYSTVP